MGESEKGGGIRPGISGQFTFYVYDPGRTEFDFSHVLTVKNNEFAENSGFYAGTTQEQEVAVYRV